MSQSVTAPTSNLENHHFFIVTIFPSPPPAVHRSPTKNELLIINAANHFLYSYIFPCDMIMAFSLSLPPSILNSKFCHRPLIANFVLFIICIGDFSHFSSIIMCLLLLLLLLAVVVPFILAIDIFSVYMRRRTFQSHPSFPAQMCPASRKEGNRKE